MRRVGVDDLATTGPGGNVPRMMDEAGQRFENAIRGAGPMPADQQLYQNLIDHIKRMVLSARSAHAPRRVD